MCEYKMGFLENTEQPDVQLTTDEVKPIELIVNDDGNFVLLITI
jgi:hypothetical protein